MHTAEYAVVVPFHNYGAEFYFNNRIIAKTRKDNDRKVISGKPSLIYLPSTLIKSGINELVIKTVPQENYSSFFNKIVFGTQEEVSSHWFRYLLKYISIISITLFLSVYSFAFFLFRGKDLFFFHFSFLSLSFSIWVTGYTGLSLWILDSQTLYFLFTFPGSFMQGFFMIFFIHSILNFKHNSISKSILTIYLLFMMLSVFIYFITSRVSNAKYFIMKPYMVFNSLVLVYGFVICYINILRKTPYAKEVLLGISIFGLSIILSIPAFIMSYSSGVYAIEGYFGMIFIFALIIASKYMRTHTDLEKAHADLLVLDKMKDDFLATTSHELRTPLHGIMGLTETLVDGSLGPVNEAQKENLEIIRTGASHLNSMVGEILDFSKLRAGKADLLLERTRVEEIASTVASLMGPSAAQKGIEIKVEESGVPGISADRNRLRQILINLIGNAVKFSERGVILVKVESAAGDGVRVTVRDEGPGIDAKDLDRIWNPFVQAEDPDTRHSGGTGLGLPITKYLVELHGGTIRAESEKGKGSAFIFELPANPAVRGIVKSRPEERQDLSFAAVVPAEAPHGEGEDNMLPAVKKYTPAVILAVDDDEINLKIIKNFCGVAGYDIFIAKNGPDALEILGSREIDLVLLDLMLPGMSGYEVCRRLRESERNSRVPVIMVTARDTSGDLVRGFSTGAGDYITKPFNRDELLVRIENQLAIRQMLEMERSVANGLRAEKDSIDSLYRRSLDLKETTLQMLAWERIIRGDLDIARTFQEKLMSHKRNIPGIDSHVHYRPIMKVGGDLFDIIEVRPGVLRVFLADATGHGITASLNTVKILSEYSAVKEVLHTPEIVLNYLNRRFIQLYRDYQIVFTCVIADVDLSENSLSLVSAGHPQSYFRTGDGVNAIKPPGPIIGLSKDFEYHQTEISIQKDEVLILYSDGLLELIDAQYKRAAGPDFDEDDALKERIAGLDASLPLEKLCASLMAPESAAARAKSKDDITIIAIRRE